MKEEEVILILAVLAGAYFITHKAPAVMPSVPSPSPPQPTYMPTPSVSPYYGYPSNLMNPSPSANNGQSWSTQDTSALITGLAGLGTAAINAFGSSSSD